MQWLALLLPTMVLCTGALGQQSVVRRVDDFSGGDLAAWQSSMSPEYYKGGTGQRGLQIVEDQERGRVLSCDVRFVNETASEPAFITRRLEPQPNQLDVVAVRFWARLSAAGIDPSGGLRVRLRTSDTAFVDYDVQQALGGPFPVGKWVRVELDTRVGPGVVNVWNSVFGTIRELTFRLDDVDNHNSHFALLIDDLELVLNPSAEAATYEPRPGQRRTGGPARVLLLQHNAAGYYHLAQAVRQVVPTARIDTFRYRGLHFEFFGFPDSAPAVADYDAVIMLDVDPFVMTWDQCAHVADAVAAGTHLIVFAGPATLTHSRTFRTPLRMLLPVTFTPAAADVSVVAPPVPQAPHPLNQGLDPTGLGIVSAVQALTVKDVPGVAVPWKVKEQPLVVTAPFQRGQVTVVNTWARVDNAAEGDFFTSPLSDDLLRQLMRHALGRTGDTTIRALTLPPLAVVGATRAPMRLEASSSAGAADVRLMLDGQRVEPAAHEGASWQFSPQLPASLASETAHHLRVDVLAPGRAEAADWRDFDITVQNPLRLAVAWERNKFTFAPGSLVEFTTPLARRDLPDIAAGESVQVSYAGGALPVRIDNFVDSWVSAPGTQTVIHNQLGSANVKTTAHGGLSPTWTVTGEPRCGRTDSALKFGADDRILRCERTVQARGAGAVVVTTNYEFLQDMKVQRLPLCVTLSTAIYSGLKYRAEQAEGVREGSFPTASATPILLTGKGLKLTVETGRGPVTIEVLDPTLRVWLHDLRQYDMGVYRFEIEAPYEQREARRGEKYAIGLRITGPVPGGAEAPTEGPFAFSATLVAPGADFRWEVPCVATEPVARFAGPLPNLASGNYELEVIARAAGRPVVTTRAACAVVDPLHRADLFPIMSIIGTGDGGHLLDEAGIRARVDDLVDHGFNTAAITGTSHFRSATPNNTSRLVSYSESYAQQRGMATTYEYSNFQMVGRNEKTVPCVFDPAYRAALQERLGWQVDVGNRTPRLLCAKVTDEPVAGMANMDYCDQCKAQFKQRYGIELKKLEEYGDDPYARFALADFIGEYVSVGYTHSAAILRELHAGFDLLLTYMSTGLGYQRPLSYQQDALDWTRHVKWADFDVYPYFYPTSQRVRMLQAGFAMTYMRDVARLRGVPWGFYAELDDRNWPFQKNPAEATAECAFTAVAHGAGYLNSFINTVAGTGTQSRPERWELAGKALRTIRRSGPVLNRMGSLRPPLAVLFPTSQQAITNGYPTPHYTLAALEGGFGEVDILTEQALVETGRIPYAGLVLTKTEFLQDTAAQALTAWLSEGGVLLCDKLPTRDQHGRNLQWDTGVAGPSATRGPLHYRSVPLGKGKVVLLENDVEDEFKRLVENPGGDPALCGNYRQALGELVQSCGLAATVRVDYRETPASADLVAAGLRGNDDGALVTVVNHQPAEQTVTVTLARPGLKWLVDLDTMEEVVPDHSDAGGLRLKLAVPGRWARMIAGYRTRPARLELKVATSQVRRGEELRYEVRVLDQAGKPVPGGVLVEVEVTSPGGLALARYGTLCAPPRGVQSVRVPLAVNAAVGSSYKVVARAPQCGLETSAQFEVK